MSIVLEKTFVEYKIEIEHADFDALHRNSLASWYALKTKLVMAVPTAPINLDLRSDMRMTPQGKTWIELRMSAALDTPSMIAEFKEIIESHLESYRARPTEPQASGMRPR